MAELKMQADMLGEFMGEDRSRNTCVFGFEANPFHTARLQALQSCYVSRGWRVAIFTETAVNDANGSGAASSICGRMNRNFDARKRSRSSSSVVGFVKATKTLDNTPFQ